MPFIENIIISLILIIAAFYLLRHLYRKGNSSSCGQSCGCCTSSCDKAPMQILDKPDNKK